MAEAEDMLRRLIADRSAGKPLSESEISGDVAVLLKMHTAVLKGMSIPAASRRFAPVARTPGTTASVAKRLERKYRRRYVGEK
jgi:hypothetical protein